MLYKMVILRQMFLNARGKCKKSMPLNLQAVESPNEMDALC